MPRQRRWSTLVVVSFLALAVPSTAGAAPEVLDPGLGVRAAADGLITPVSTAFIADDDMLVLEKNTGRVQRVRDGHAATVLDLAVNFGSERGLLGIALHPDFPAEPAVFLYWTESTTGADSNALAETPLLGNRVDRFTWDGSSLTFAGNVVRLRAFQQDAGQPQRGNHDGGVLAFGPDGKLYVIVGDLGRRGHMQNLTCGPTTECPGAIVADDQFGGPAPDDAHLSGVVLRLDPDGTAPSDNPFYGVGAMTGGEVGANLQKVFAYGIRNSFGMAFDPRSGDLWTQENADDAFDELNRVEAGSNSGWIQIMGPAERIAEFKGIETAPGFFGLQQIRWPPTNLADTPHEALARLHALPGSHYSDPEFSWKFAVAPAGIGFLSGRALGPQYDGDLFVGAARPSLEAGYLFRLNLTGNRRKVAVDDPRIEDRVADNVAKFDGTESESLLFGRGFGVGTDVDTGPNGNLYVTSLTDGAVYEVFRR